MLRQCVSILADFTVLVGDTISLSGEVAYLSVDERAVKQMVGGATLWYEQDT